MADGPESGYYTVDGLRVRKIEWKVAAHEAGHAVIACLKDIPFTRVWILPADNPWWDTREPMCPAGGLSWQTNPRIHVRLLRPTAGTASLSPDTEVAIEDQIISYQAGRVAEITITGFSRAGSDHGDLEVLNKLLDDIARGVANNGAIPWLERGFAREKRCIEVQSKTAALVNEWQATIWRVAVALLRYRSLTKEEVAALMG